METRWFGFTLLQLCKLLVIADLIIALTGFVSMLVLSIWNFTALDLIKDFEEHNNTRNEFKFIKLNYDNAEAFAHSVHISKYWCIAYMVIAPVVFVLESCLFKIIWSGIKTRNPTRCRWWFKCRLIVVDLPSIYFITSFIRWIAYRGIIGLPMVIGILAILYRSFQLSIIFDFVVETETGQKYGKLNSRTPQTPSQSGSTEDSDILNSPEEHE